MDSSIWLLIMVIACLPLAVLSFGSNSDKKTLNQIARIERKLNLLIEHFGLQEQLQGQISQEVRRLVEAGQRIQALKLYRKQNPGVELREAREVVEALERREL
jgi:ribosomal protein L7/L12